VKRYSLLISSLVLLGLVTPVSQAQKDDVYPYKGQSEEQIMQDKKECYEQAMGESGFDPLLPPSASQPQDQQAAANDQSKQEKDYDRAYRSCLKSRGYAVK
jgi:hypothetical protein